MARDHQSSQACLWPALQVPARPERRLSRHAAARHARRPPHGAPHCSTPCAANQCIPQWYNYWDEPLAHRSLEHFLYAGSKLMVVAVLRENATQAPAVFPRGHVWHPVGDNQQHPVVDARAATVATNLNIPLEDVAVYLKGALRNHAFLHTA